MDASAQDKATKVFWTDDEKRLLAKEIDLALYLEAHIGYNVALARAMEHLPVDRRRSVKAWSLVREQLEPYLQAARKLREKAVTNLKAETAEIEKQKTDQHADWLAYTVELLVPVVCKLLDHPEVRKKFVGLQHSTGSSTRDLEGFGLPKVVRPFKLKVVIAGLLPAQSEEIKKTFQDEAELKFWRSDESKDHLRTLVRNADVAIAMTDFISHSADQIMASNGARYVRHSGGVSKLKETILQAIAHSEGTESASSRGTETVSFAGRP